MLGIRFIKISVVYFVVGVCIGLAMSITHSYTLTPVHVHINLLGWTAMTLAGILYHLFPQIAATKLAKTHFWLHNISLPLMMAGLAFVVNGNTAIVPLVAAGGTVLVLAIILFALNILMNLKPQKT
ncbi:cytochrome-c oxidase [Peribacillus saganii]|uniref:Cytochrome-c oxidase n=1 Tax=Peribacillus saganii TaxID=2303992 RepID=A0A372LDC3_9BACI|nr:cytochrome-c oxidase [Peribacillus saganii]RFU63154.1 cytochrome-c oxidase [Peribacillus saganii]